MLSLMKEEVNSNPAAEEVEWEHSEVIEKHHSEVGLAPSVVDFQDINYV